MKVGDSLRESIERGLQESDFCVLILTPDFLAKGGWPKAEFTSAFTKETFEDRNIMLPVWHNISAKDVYEYSPRISDKVGIPWDQTTASKLFSKLMTE